MCAFSLHFLIMIVFAVRKEDETNEKFILRYKKLFFQSRTANKMRKEAYHTSDLTRRKRRERAIVRAFYRTSKENTKAF